MNRVFILGAGFSYYISGCEFPLMKQLGQEFKSEFPWVSTLLLNEELEEINLESLLTQLDLKLINNTDSDKHAKINKRILDIKIFLRDRLSNEKVRNEIIEESEPLCLKLFKDNDTIITFNYDCLLENILWNIKYWSPCGGYGKPPELNVGNLGSQIEENPKNITILKPHGSINFIEIGSENEFYLKPWIDDKLFPNIHAHWNEQEEAPPMVLPSFLKIFGENRTFIHIWHEAIEKISNADVLNLIGYSFPKSDSMTRFLLSFLNADEFKARGTNKLRINILNKGSDSDRVLEQIKAVGMFGYDDIEVRLLSNCDAEDYKEIGCISC